jgi:hypothetical protein
MRLRVLVRTCADREPAHGLLGPGARQAGRHGDGVRAHGEAADGDDLRPQKCLKNRPERRHRHRATERELAVQVLRAERTGDEEKRLLLVVLVRVLSKLPKERDARFRHEPRTKA